MPEIGERVAEAIAIDDLERKWGLPEGAGPLFQGLDALELLAVADLVERYWRAVSNARDDEPGANLSPQRFWEIQ